MSKHGVFEEEKEENGSKDREKGDVQSCQQLHTHTHKMISKWLKCSNVPTDREEEDCKLLNTGVHNADVLQMLREVSNINMRWLTKDT